MEPEPRSIRELSFRLGAKGRLLLAFGVMVTLTIAVGGVAWLGFGNVRQALDAIEEQSLPAVSRSMTLARHSAALVAQAGFVANARTRFQLEAEARTLSQRLESFLALARDTATEEDAAAREATDSARALWRLANQVKTTLLELVAVTRENIDLGAAMHERRYQVLSARDAVERTVDAAPGGEGAAAVMAEVHRMAGALAAAITAPDVHVLATFHDQYRRGADDLATALARVSPGALGTRLAQLGAPLRRLGASPESVFDLRRAQFDNADRRSYLLTVSNVQSERLAALVATLVEGVRQETAMRSAKVATVLDSGKARILLLGAVCLLAALASAFYVVRDLAGNLASVARAMRQLAEGDRSVAVPALNRRDEIGTLARSFEVFRENAFRFDAASRELVEKSHLLQAIFENMNDGLAVFDTQGQLLTWNGRFLALYGAAPDALAAGMGIESVQRTLAGGELRALNMDGSPLDLEDVSRRRQRASQRFEQYLPDGRVLELRSDPMPGGGFVTIYTDLSQRKAIEQQLRQAQKMEIVGQLTGGLAHDFNNLLAVIIGNLSLLQEDLAGQERLRRKALRALDAADRGATITQRLLAFSRKQALQPRAVDPNALVEGMLDLLSYTVGEALHLETRLQDGVWPVCVDPGQLENALMNLVVNARDATAPGGRVLIHTANEPAGGSADRVRIEVEDDGSGMAPEVLERVYEPFFTTKEVGAGSGLGLSMVYGFITQSGGEVEIRSAPGQGTTVSLHLPRSATDGERERERERERSSRTLPPPEAFRGRGETVLVVDDDPGVRQAAVNMLQRLGCHALEAADAAAALECLDANPALALMLVDVVLPGSMNGPELVAEARRRRPDIKVLYSSGYTRNALVRDGHLDPRVDLLQKPYRPEALARRLQRLMRGSAVP